MPNQVKAKEKNSKSILLTSWQQTLKQVLIRYTTWHQNTSRPWIKIFCFFLLFNITCYWLGMLTAFPDTTFGAEARHYFMLQVPVGVLGAAFVISFYYFGQLLFYLYIYIQIPSIKVI